MSGNRPGAHSDLGGPPYQYPIQPAADSSAKSRIPSEVTSVYIAAITTNADDWLVLPQGVQPGHRIRGWSLVQHEIRTEAASNIKINDVDSDGSNEALIPATTMWTADYVSVTQGWILRGVTKLGADQAAIVPDNV